MNNTFAGTEGLLLLILGLLFAVGSFFGEADFLVFG